MAGGRSAVLPNRPATAHEPAKPEAKPASFAVGCKQRGDTTWSTNRMRYATRAEALAAGHDLAGRWMGLDTWQVIETQDAVTARWDNEKGSILLDVKGADAPVPQVAIPVVVPIVPVSAPISIPVNHTSAPAAAARVGVTPLWRRRLQSLLVLASAP